MKVKGDTQIYSDFDEHQCVGLVFARKEDGREFHVIQVIERLSGNAQTRYRLHSVKNGERMRDIIIPLDEVERMFNLVPNAHYTEWSHSVQRWN